MKKLVYTLFIMGITSTALLSQDAKNVRFGLFVRGVPSWLKSGDQINYPGNGIRFGFGFGMNLEFRITDVVSFATGIGGDMDGGKLAYRNVNAQGSNQGYSTGYVVDKSNTLVDLSGQTVNSVFSNNNYTPYTLINRTLKTTYVTIPLAFKMMTKDIGGFKYFGNFGGNLGVLVGAKADDVVLNSTNAQSNLSGLNVYKDMNFARVGLNMGIGAEYNLSGSTSLVFSLNYVNSFLSLGKSPSKYLSNGINNNSFSMSDQSFKSNGIQINIGVLF